MNRDGAPQARYFEFLDRSRSKQVVAAGVREAFSDLFALNVKANELGASEVKNKLRTLFAGKKSDVVIDRISSTFKVLCEYADFSGPLSESTSQQHQARNETTPSAQDLGIGTSADQQKTTRGKITVSGLQYHINIVLPESRDQSVYDAIFKSLRDHLG